ncbi:hypothetical protein [Legionella cardiaca]|uniref:Coiled-coil protein n=1 Tax=Legionella cardiaca TaxID=1071983 RepID=A0ABY8AR14_9GAMM|nr:hypothetical protein [Legionella cardiaca]WED43130.1 hypothetical protein PXX05_14715 [Legionella cardiaca]
MAMKLSTASQDLISQLCKKNPNLASTFQHTGEIERPTLLEWFEKTPMSSDDDEIFLMASLHASLLKDFYDSIKKPSMQVKEKKKPVNWYSKIKYAVLAIAGTIYFGCEGFDGITAIMGIFSSIPTLAIFAAGTLFSILSVIVFYSFDLVEISKNLGVKSSDAPQLLDVLLDEFKQIKVLRLELAKASNKTQEQLQSDLAIANMLLKRHQELDEARKKLKEALSNPKLKMAKILTAAVAGIIFFSGGFFAGQTVAMAVAGLFMASVAATFWPIVLASIVVGLAAFSVYWFVERPGIENLISRWKGLDKEKIDALCKSRVVDRETEKLQGLIDNLNEKVDLHSRHATSDLQVSQLTEEVSRLRSQLEDAIKEKQSLETAMNDEFAFSKTPVSSEVPPQYYQSGGPTMFAIRKTKSTGDLVSYEHSLGTSEITQ